MAVENITIDDANTVSNAANMIKVNVVVVLPRVLMLEVDIGSCQ